MTENAACKWVWGAALSAAILLPHIASAQSEGSSLTSGMPEVYESPIVLELFTSQGCSSCPPADEIFAQLSADPRLITLALHVDYWDYLGWQDEYGQAAFTERQKAYASAIRERMIYTPQLIIQGDERVVASRPAEIEAALQQIGTNPSPVSLHIARKDADKITIEAQSSAPLNAALMVQLVRYIPSAEVTIERGENEGMTIAYHNIVTDWQELGLWDGASALEIEAEAGGDAPVVVILQEQGPAEILAAARLQ